MINDDTRKLIKFIIWTLIVIVILYIASILTFFRAGSSTRQNERNIAAIASKQTPITQISNYYHLDRGIDSYALAGANKKGQKYYFIYLPKSKKAYLYPENKGINQNTLINDFKKSHNQKITQVNLGWYDQKPVWEITYQKNDNFAFNLYDFKTGKAINQVDNL